MEQKKSTGLRVKHIRLHDVAGIEDLEIEPGRVTVISGKNETGKSSVIRALRAVFKGGTDATLLRKGTDSGEIVLLLDNGTEIKTQLTNGKQSLRVKHHETGVVGAAQSYLNSLHDGLGMNPIDLITARPEKRGEFLLEAIPMTLSEDQIDEIAGDLVYELPSVEGKHALRVIAEVSKTLYATRRDANRDAKSKRTTAEQLGNSLPDECGDTVSLRKQKGITESKKDAISKSLLSGIEKQNEIRDREVAFQRAERDVKLREIERSYEERIAATEKRFASARDFIRESAAPKVERLSAEIARLETRLETAVEHANTAAVIEKMNEDAVGLELQSENLTIALKSIDDLKAGFLDDLPLPIEIGSDGEIYQDGLPFTSLNTQRQVEIAMQVAALRSGKIGLVVVDGLELLDSEHFGAVKEWAMSQDDIQLIVTRVTDESFSVDTYSPEVSHA